jgi:hypothetical protein
MQTMSSNSRISKNIIIRCSFESTGESRAVPIKRPDRFTYLRILWRETDSVIWRPEKESRTIPLRTAIALSLALIIRSLLFKENGPN